MVKKVGAISIMDIGCGSG